MADLSTYQPSKSENAQYDNQLSDGEEFRNFNDIISDNNYIMDGDVNEGEGENLGYTLEFLSDYEENLPEYFDESTIKRENSNTCKLCSNKFSLIAKSKHHCRKCGATVCNNCSQGRLKLSKRSKQVRVWFKCEIEITNVGLINMYKEFVERKKKEKEELLQAIKNKRKAIESKK